MLPDSGRAPPMVLPRDSLTSTPARPLARTPPAPPAATPILLPTIRLPGRRLRRAAPGRDPSGRAEDDHAGRPVGRDRLFRSPGPGRRWCCRRSRWAIRTPALSLPASARPLKLVPMKLPSSTLPGRAGPGQLDAVVVVARDDVAEDLVVGRVEDEDAVLAVAEVGGGEHVGADEVADDPVAADAVEDDAVAGESVDRQAVDRAAAGLDDQAVGAVAGQRAVQLDPAGGLGLAVDVDRVGDRRQRGEGPDRRRPCRRGSGRRSC